MIWKLRRTPARRQYYQLAPQERPTAATDYGLWPTAQARDYRSGVSLAQTAKSAAAGLWPTPRTNDAEKRGQIAPDPRNGLPAAALWTTPSTRDHKDSPGMTAQRKDGKNRNDQLPRQVFQTLWATPKASDPMGGRTTKTKGGGNSHLPSQIRDFGTAENGSPVPMKKIGSLNPAFPCWLMGYPIAWENCADMVTLSSRKSRRNSSKQRHEEQNEAGN